LGSSGAPPTAGTADIGKRSWSTPLEFGARRFSGDSSNETFFAPVNPNAPWQVGGGFAYSSDNGFAARIGAVGHRNYRLPLSMSRAIASGHDLTLPLASFTDLLQPEVQWELLIGVQKTLIRTSGGRTIGAVADVFVPLNSTSPTLASPGQVLPSRTVRLGVTFGF
jgi:hypothetical protein